MIRSTTAVLVALTCSVGVVGAQDWRTPDPAAAMHLLNRAAFGARPGDVRAVTAMGLETWIDRQLAPERIADSAIQAYLARVPVVWMSVDDLHAVFTRQQRARRERQRAMAQNDMAPMRPTPPNEVGRHLADFQQVAVARAVLSERQLYEVMVDFWTNHFNVFLNKGPVRYLAPSYIEETIRPRALGRFEDLLIATAESPAMLVYLDNAQSVAPGAEPPPLAQLRRRARTLPPRRAGQRARIDSAIARFERRLPRGLNENYARELMELHTLGVDGGYTQADVVAVARILTGWSVRQAPGDVGFVFNAWAHDRGEKEVLGRSFRTGGGQDEGLELLRLLAAHPATVRHVSGKLCRRFVSDEPPPGCIDAAVREWERTGGEIRAVVRGILMSPDFWAPEHRGAKIKTPLEFVASAARATGSRPDSTPVLGQVVARLGQPLYRHSAPTGYPEREEAWVNSGALLQRFSVALAIAAGRARGLIPPVTGPLDGVGLEDLVPAVNAILLGGLASDGTLRTITTQLAEIRQPAAARALAIGLALGSPDFQRQ